jgi:hypothetical protein
MTKQLLSRARRRRALAREANVYLVIIAGPARHEETILTAEVDLTKARTERNWSTRWATTIARISSGLP